MRRTPSIVSVVLGILTVALIAGGFNSFQRKRSTFERLDFKSRRDAGVIVVEEVDRNSSAERAGLRSGDAIIAIAGSPASEVDGIRRTLRRAPQPVPLLVQRGEQTFQLRYRVPDLKIEYPYLFLTFIGFLYLAIGIFTLFRGGRRESLLFFFVTLLAFVVYVYSPAGQVDGKYRLLLLVEEFARIFLPPLALHFFLRFPRPLMTRRWIIPSLYVLPCLLALWNIDVLLLENTIEIASPRASLLIIDRWEMLHFAVYFTLAFVALTYTYRTAPAAGQKKQVKWIYLGMGAGFIPFLILYLVPFVLNGTRPAFSNLAILPLAFIPLAFAVSILRYKLWDVEVVIKEILAYTVTFVFGMVAFSTVNVMLSHFLADRLTLEKNFLAFASGLVIAGVLVPIKGRIESAIEMLLYRETYRHRKAFVDFAKELGQYRDLSELLEVIRERLQAAIGVEQMNAYLQDGGLYLLYRQEAPLPTRILVSELAALPTDRPMMLSTPRLPDESDKPLAFLQAGYRYVFPLHHRGEPQGLLLFGTKEGEEALSRDDIQLIHSITAPLALAVENARLYGRLRRQLDEIRSLKEYNENIIESSSSAIVVVASDGVVLTANNAFWDLIGAGPEHDDHIHVLFPPYSDIQPNVAGAVERHFVNHRGEEKDLAISVSPFVASDAPPGTMVVVIGDISDRVRLERELQEKERLASLGLLAAGVAHEVNTPLTGISSYAQLLLADTSPDDPRYALLKKMEQQTFRASHLVNNLLDFASRRSATPGEAIVAEAVAASLALAEPMMEKKRIQVHTEIPPEPMRVAAGESELQQVVTNLLLNARDAVQPDGNIWISARRDGGNAVVEVRDDGCGIASDLQESIFQPLVTTKRAQGGTGLGLAISRKIVEGAGGTITLRSTPGNGATFVVSLPLTRAAGR